jgi:ribonuclease P protein component
VRPRAFPASLRLKQRREFLRVQRGGRKHHVRHFIVFVAPRVADPSPTSSLATRLVTRLGITVTRKVGNAVARNRIKRLVREVFRQHRERLPGGLDIVWVAKQNAGYLDFAAVLADFESLVRSLAAPTSQRREGRRR